MVSRRTDALDAGVGDDLVLLSLERGSYHALDPVAAVVWRKLDTATTIEALCLALANEFDVSAEQCEADVMAFLAELEQRHLLQVHDH